MNLEKIVKKIEPEDLTTGVGAAATTMNKQNFKEEEYNFKSGKYEIKGTLSYPSSLEDKIPGVVLVHGSGSHDRDETVFLNKPFRDIAHYLSSKGIAVLRYDKRTFTYKINRSVQEFKDITIKEEVIDDAVNAVKSLSSLSYIQKDEIYVIGHSLGAWCTPLIADILPSIKGVCLMAGNARPIDVIITEQMEYQFRLHVNQLLIVSDEIIETKKNEINAYFDKIKNDEIKDDEILAGFPVYPAYWKYWLTTDPIGAIKNYKNKVLVLQGENDCQISMEDFRIWKNTLKRYKKKNYKTVSFPKLNHFFMRYEGKSTGKEYLKEGHVDKKVLKALENWIKKR